MIESVRKKWTNGVEFDELNVVDCGAESPALHEGVHHFPEKQLRITYKLYLLPYDLAVKKLKVHVTSHPVYAALVK